MQDLDKALADIVAIRMQIARDTAFRGLGAATLGITAVLALAVAGAQGLLLDDPTGRPGAFFSLWIATAILACALIGVEAVRRSRRVHSGLADAMVFSAIEGFLPAGGVGLCLGLIFARLAPDQIWMLPGLWQVLVGLGLFASARILPRAVQFVGAWYLLAGFAVLAVASEPRHLSPWLMGLPFAVGQGLLAVIVHHQSNRPEADADV